MRELLRPPAHRGPLIAAGAVVLAVGIALEEVRLRDQLGSGAHLLILALAAALVLALGLQADSGGGPPHAFQSVLVVTGLLLLYPALLRLADVLGADFGGSPSGAFAWTGFVEAGVAAWAALRRRSAVSLLIAAIAAAGALLWGVDWAFGIGSPAPSRWILLALALAFALGSLGLRAGSARHAEVLVDAAGLAILGIAAPALAAVLFGGSPAPLPGFWELVVLAAGCGLVAFGAVDRAPGPAWLGFADLAAFVAVVGLSDDATLRWWPLALVVLGAGAMAAGLRPRRPLPPEPRPYRMGEAPLAARAEPADETRSRRKPAT